MVVTKDVRLPEFADLETCEVNVSTATLMSAAPYLGKACEDVNNEFMLCRLETNDARACVSLGKCVTKCALQTFQTIKKHCLDEFNQYAKCIEKSSGDFSFTHCRKTQGVFDDCMGMKACMSRPDLGYFCRGRIHKTLTDLPESTDTCPCQPPVPDPTPSLPDEMPRQYPRFGMRNFWTTD